MVVKKPRGRRRQGVGVPGSIPEPRNRAVLTTPAVERQLAGFPSASARLSSLAKRWQGLIEDLAPRNRTVQWWSVVMAAFMPDLGIAVAAGDDPVWETLVVFEHLYGDEVRRKHGIDVAEVIGWRETAPWMRWVLADLGERWWLCPSDMPAGARLEALGIVAAG